MVSCKRLVVRGKCSLTKCQSFVRAASGKQDGCEIASSAVGGRMVRPSRAFS